jgi:hypothetical protein
MAAEIHEAVAGSALYQKVMANAPYWGGERILGWDSDLNYEMEPFKTHHYWKDSTTLNTFRVVGTSHPEYQGMTWLELLGQGKRMWDNLPKYDRNPVYYDGTETKEPKMSFRSMDGVNWYVNADGNHRTTVAKFAFYYQGRADIHGVELDDYRFDHELHGVYQRLRNVIRERRIANVQIHPKSICTGRHDTAGWRLDLFKAKLECDSSKNGKRELGFQEAERYLSELQAPFYRRWFRAWGRGEV